MTDKLEIEAGLAEYVAEAREAREFEDWEFAQILAARERAEWWREHPAVVFGYEN